jgi:DNA-binding MarR family transcriptional regulator
MALSERGRLRFSELESMLEVSKPDLAFHLNRLVQTGLVSHVYERFPSDESYAYYRLSELGESLLLSIEQAFTPPLQPREPVSWQPALKRLKVVSPLTRRMLPTRIIPTPPRATVLFGGYGTGKRFTSLPISRQTWERETLVEPNPRRVPS